MLDDYAIVETIATGERSKVKLVRDPQGKFYSAKLQYYTTESSKKLVSNFLLNEIQALRSLTGSKTIQMISVSFEGKHVTSSSTLPCVYLISSYCPLGSFCSLSKLKPSESVSRYFFQRIAQGLDSIHAQGIKHLNIKLENILIDLQMNPRFCGFSFATDLESVKSSKIHVYSAPEIVNYKAVCGKKADIFALGVVLFILVCGIPPFLRASLTDSHYKLLQGKKATFWSGFSRVSEDFKELIEGMLKENPNERFDIERVKTHRWTKAEINTEELETIRRKLMNNSS